MGATILWDALVSSCIMLQAQIRGFGVYTNAEVFNDVLEHNFDNYKEISEDGKLQIVRCVGCAVIALVLSNDIHLMTIACISVRCTESQS